MTAPAALPRLYLSTNEFATLYGVSPAEIRRMCSRKELAYERRGRLFVIPRREAVRLGLAEDAQSEGRREKAEKMREFRIALARVLALAEELE